jgi:streptogramin lyase
LKGNNPTDVAIGLGAVWVNETDTQTLGKIDPKSNEESDQIKLQGDSPVDVAVGFDAIWTPIGDSNFLLRVKP